MVRGTRGYIEKVTNQVNGCYEKGWFDSCAVMMRRLLETLIIECFEKHGIDATIKDASGDFLFLRDLITRMLQETAWNLGRNVKAALPRLKTSETSPHTAGGTTRTAKISTSCRRTSAMCAKSC